MQARTVTRSIDVETSPDLVLDVVRDPARIPTWAPAFADSIEPDGDGWRVTRNNRAFHVRVKVDHSMRCVNIVRDIAPAEEGGLFMRILPRPGGGSVIVATIPIVPGSDADRTGVILNDELDRIATLVAHAGGDRQS
jgi:hypothetical protein